MTDNKQHEQYMRLALAEAAKGLGRTSPNPAVGAVIVRNDTVIGCGYHKKAGTAHAEVNALADAREKKLDTRGASMYVTLEPCNHSGRTPPCTEAILAAGISEVFIGTRDPNAQVTGGGAEFLAARGVQVRLDICRQQCRALIAPFVKHSRSGLPWVVMKAGMSLDGRITMVSGTGGPITGPETSLYVHRLRNRLDGILVGVGTALIDDPSLTTRLADEEARDPLRIVLDSSLRLPPNCRMLSQQSASSTWVFCSPNADATRETRLLQAGAQVIRLAGGTTNGMAGAAETAGGLDLKQVLHYLGSAGIASVLVEGGAQVHGSFLAADLVDEVALVLAPYFIGEAGTPLVRGYSRHLQANPPKLCRISSEQLGADTVVHGYFIDPDSLFP